MRLSLSLPLALTVSLTAAFGEAAGTTFAFDVIAYTGEAAPDVAGATYSSLGDPVISSNGIVAYGGGLAGALIDSTNDRGIWVNGGLLVQEDDEAPGTDGARFSNLGNFLRSPNASGELAYSSGLTGNDIDSTNNAGIWTSTGLVVQKDDEAPDTGGQKFVGSFVLPYINDSGEVAYRGTISGKSGIWTSNGLVALKGEPADGGSGATYNSFGNPSVNTSGEVAYGGVLSSNLRGIWTTNGLVALKGQTAPGTGDATYSFLGEHALNDSGQVVYNSSLAGGDVTGLNDSSVWLDDQLLRREGDPATGVANATWSNFGNPALNNLGQVAFEGFLKGPDIVFELNSRGVWIDDDLVVREGDVIDVAGLGLRTFSDFGVVRGGLSDSGQLTFHASFLEGGEAIFLATPENSIPEPTCYTLTALALAALGWQRRRRKA